MKKTVIEEGVNIDHDTLIRVETKLDILTTTVNDLQSGMIERMLKVEQRLDFIDNFHAKVDYDKLVPLIDWTTNFKANIKFISVMITILATLLSGILVIVLQKVFKI